MLLFVIVGSFGNCSDMVGFVVFGGFDFGLVLGWVWFPRFGGLEWWVGLRFWRLLVFGYDTCCGDGNSWVWMICVVWFHFVLFG